MADYDIFRERLAIKYPSYGHALWEPSPRNPDRPVRVGDVGFIRRGKFYRLFNALLSADDPTNVLGVPECHEPLVPTMLDHLDTRSLGRNNYCSPWVSMKPDPGYHSSGPNDFQQISFQYERTRGAAVLSLPVAARREDTLAQDEFKRWILRHIDSWFTFTRRFGLGIQQMEEIILVDAHVSFGVKTEGPDTINFRFSPENAPGAVLCHGPEGTNLPENQCVFIRGFRVARSFWKFPRRLEAAAGPSSDPGGYDPDTDSEVISIPANTQYRDPLYLLLDHIAERATDCDMVLIHDDDLGRIEGFGHDSSIEALEPEVMTDLLWKSNITINKVSCDLSLTDRVPNTDTAVTDVKVAMLSMTSPNWSRPLSVQSVSLPRNEPGPLGYGYFGSHYTPSSGTPRQTTSGEHSASYGQHDCELRSAQAATLPRSPPATHQNVPYMEPRSTPPSLAKLTTQSPTGQSVKARTPDKSLPVQEEFEEDGAYEHHTRQEPERDRWTPSGSEYGRYANRYDQEVRDIERQHHATSSPTPSWDLLPDERFDARYDPRPKRNGRENHVQSQRGKSDDAMQRHDGEDEDGDVQHSGRSQSQDEESYTPRSPAATYYGHLQSPMATHPRPGAPIPPTPHTNTAAPLPSPLISGMGCAIRHKPVLSPYSPAPPVGSPYPYPYGHIRRRQNSSVSYNGTMDFSQMDPNVVREQLALQMQIYALNNGGMVSDSTLSPSSTPFPGPQYNPWAFLQTSNVFGGRRGGISDSTASMQSSPSHQPVSLPPRSRRGRGLRRRERSQDLRRRARLRPPPRVESTQPRGTSPELSSGEETPGEFKVSELRSVSQRYARRPARWDTLADDEDEDDADDGEWIDEDIGTEGVTDDLLQLEFHTDYVSNPEKRRRRWKSRWESLLRSFHALDRETDTTLVLLAAPSHSDKLRSVASRAIRRDVELLESSDMVNMRSAFAEVAARRRASRSASLLEQLSRPSSSPRDGSPSGSSDVREEDLRRALDTAIGSLRALGGLYEQREMRWAEEKHRLDEDKEKVQLLLRQVLGVGVVGDVVETAL